MNVENLMTHEIEACNPDDSLTDAAMIMWRRDCGIVPVVKPDTHEVAGVITDRDICMAAASRGLALPHIAASQAMSQSVRACLPDDEISEALDMMKHFKVRRLPVIDAHGYLQGVISMSDITRAADANRGLASKDVVSTLAEICDHRTLTAV
jgi:CBS domain-containing protein